METVTFKSVLEGVAVRLGIDPATLQATQARALGEYIDGALRRGWQADGWWPWVSEQERRWRQTWVSGTAYALGAEVWFAPEEKYFVALAGTAAGESPLTHPAKWEEIDELAEYLNLQEVGYGPVGDILAVTATNGAEYGFELRGDRIYIPQGPPVVVVRFTLRRPRFSGEEWSATGTYGAGAVVYRATVGDCYLATGTATVGLAPENNSTHWVKQEFPEILSEYAKLAAYGDALREDGQIEKGAVIDQKAESALADEFDRVFFKQQQTRRFRVRR